MSQSCRKRSRTSAVDSNEDDSDDNDCLSSASESMLSEGYSTWPGNSQNQPFDRAPPDDSTNVTDTQQSSGYCSFPSSTLQVDPTLEAVFQPLVPNNSDHTHSPHDADSSSCSSVIFVDETSLDLRIPDSPQPESWTTHEFSASLLTKTFGPQASFRDPQQQVIEYLVNERCRILVIEPAGWGKTFVYVAAAMAIRQFAHRVTLVATPLLALMRNQAELARSYGAEVESLSSQADSDDRTRIRRRIVQRDVDVVLTTPEQLSGAFFADDDDDHLLDCVGMLVVDEAQCITQWGSDFRPDFRRLAAVVERLPRQTAIMATTATATAVIAEDIRNVLRIEDKWCIRGELHLPSVRLQVVKVRMKGGGGLAWLVQNIPRFAGTGIIYCLKIVTAETIARLLRANGVDARAYYSSVLPPRDAEGCEEFAGDSNAYRQHLEQQFSENKLKVLVATSALGMGFDKPDVGFVVLYQSPISLATFYQQLGRAGRRIDSALGIVVHDGRACHLQRFFIEDTLYKRDELVSIIETLGYSRDNDGGVGMTVYGELERKCNVPTKRIEAALKFLTTLRHPPVDSVANNEGHVAWRKIREPNYEFYENIRLRAIEAKQADWKLVMKLCNLKGKRQCLMRQLCKDLGGRSTPKYRCGRCAVCLREPILPAEVDSAILDSVIQQMKSASDLPLVLKQTVPVGAFTEYDFPDELLGRVEEGKIMCNWREPGWGEIIADECYYSEPLNDDIVEAAAELITERWQPNPRLRWVTCIPPATAATQLVPDFAKRLSTRLGLRFRRAVKISKPMQPKKDQKNAFYRCRNLDGGYVINRKKMLKGPVLLVDYLVRSSWTLTVVAALLNRAGSGEVFPLALAKIGGHDID